MKVFKKPEIDKHFIMENTNDSTSNNDEPTIKDSKKRISYVSKEHKAMFDFVSVIYKELGFSDYHSKEQIAKANNLSPDTIKTWLPACQLYGLLEIKHGTGYKITELFRKIYHPLNDDEQKADIIKSLKSPDMYVSLFGQYENHPLPPINGIKNHFVRNFELRDAIATRTAEVFINNINEYKLLDVKGVLITDVFKSRDPEEIHVQPDEPNHNTETSSLPIRTQNQVLIQDFTGESNKKIPIFLTQKKVAFLVYPDEITVSDIKLIEHQVAGILLRLELENEER